MSNLVQIFEIYKDYPIDLVDESIQYLHRCESRSLDPSLTQDLADLKNFFITLRRGKSAYLLSHDAIQINYLLLHSMLQQGKVEEYISLARAMKAELLAVTTKESFEEFVKLHDY